MVQQVPRSVEAKYCYLCTVLLLFEKFIFVLCFELIPNLFSHLALKGSIVYLCRQFVLSVDTFINGII